MQSVIYVDVLFIINFFITFLILVVTTKFVKTTAKIVRLIMGGIIGGVYSFVILFPNLSVLLSSVGKFFCALLIVFVSMQFKTFGSYIKTVLVFFFSNLLFLGIIVGLWMIFKPKGFYINNACVYLGVSAKTLLLSAFVAYLITTLIIRVYNKAISSKQIYGLTIYSGEKTVNLFAFSDSGNNLKEPFSSFPVIIVDEKKISDFGREKGVRLVPFETISGNGLLEAFKPDKVVVKANSKEKILYDVYVAYSKNSFEGKDFSAILNPKILNE